MAAVLILDANQRSALAVTRSLGELGLTILTADCGHTALSGASKYSSKYLRYPAPQSAPLEFLSWIRDTLEREHVGYIFPTTEITSQLLLMNPEALGKCRLPFASYNTVMTLAAKDKLVKAAQAARISVPESQFYSHASEVNPASIPEFPVVVKPSLSRIWCGNNWLNTVVTVAHSREELEQQLNNCEWLHNYPFMLQKFIPGHGAGLFALYNKGEPVAFFAHRRVREKPPEGGVSVLSESVPLDPNLLRPAKQLLDSVSWHGVAMVEFRISPDGTPYLMEVNTRFWGSLQLAIDAGVNFPALLYKISSDQILPPPSNYTLNVRLRWILGDLDSLYIYLKSSHYSLNQKIRRILSFLNPFPLSTRHEVNRLSDFGPTWTELKHYISNLR